MVKNIFIICLFYLFTSCQQVKNSNPFDPENNDTVLDIDLQLSNINSSILIRWQIPKYPNYNFTEIYKSTNEMDFSLLSSVDKNINSVIDSNIAEEVKYSYFLKLIGDDVETKPTKHFSITTGPGDIWITDSYLSEILRLNYDLARSSIRKNGYGKPENLCIAKNIHKGIATYPIIKYFEIFNTDNGIIQKLIYTNFHPFDAVYNDNLNTFFISDSSGGLYQVDTSLNVNLVSDQFKNPTQIEIIDNNLILLDSKINTIHFYNIIKDSTESITLTDLNENFHNIKLFRLDKINRNIYILDRNGSSSTIYKYALDKKVISVITTGVSIQSFDVYSQNESIWIVTSKGLNFELVQLSNSGERLLSVPRDFNNPRDVKVNPYNGNVLLVDFLDVEASFDEKVFHFKGTKLVGSYKTYGDPNRIYIE